MVMDVFMVVVLALIAAVAFYPRLRTTPDPRLRSALVGDWMTEGCPSPPVRRALTRLRREERYEKAKGKDDAECGSGADWGRCPA